MKQTPVFIIYDALSLSFSVQVVGGSLTQRKDALTGEFDPDRTMFPLMLQPSLMVQDPNHVLVDGDHTSKLIDCRWYIGTDEKGTPIVTGTEGYTLGEYGKLVVSVNVEPDRPLQLFFSCSYIDSRTGKVFRKSMPFTLDTVLKEEVNLGIEIDASSKLLISPFKTHAQRKITATFRNGQDIVPDDAAQYRWMVQDQTTRQMRLIRDDDPFYVSGQNTKSLVIDRRYIDKELVEVQANLKSLPKKVVSAHTKIMRWYGWWEENIYITRGKFIRPDTTEIEAQAEVTTPKGVVANPTDFFDMTHYRTGKYADAPQFAIGLGEKVVVPRSSIGSDPNAVPVFGIEVFERTALRPLQLDGSELTVDGKRICIQIPVKTK